MKSLPVYAMSTAAIAAALAPTIATAQPAPRDGKVEQAVQDTVAASLKRRGYPDGSTVVIATKDAIRQAITDATNQGSAITGVNSPNRTWAETIKGLLQNIAAGFFYPINIGSTGAKPQSFAGGGTYGGGGTTGSWDPDCSDLKISFDAENHLIIPTYSLKTGEELKFGGFNDIKKYELGSGLNSTSAQATARWGTHKLNETRIPQRWFGIIGPEISGNEPTTQCVRIASVAFRDSENILYPRETQLMCSYQSTFYGPYNWSDGYTEIQCPQQSLSGGTDFHFYGNSHGYGNWHNHQCTMYAPNPQLGEGGYFINKQTSIPFNGGNFPAQLAPGFRQCATDKNFIKRIADALAKAAAAKPGYAGAPYAPILDEDTRPDGTIADDLADEPTTGTRPDPNPTTVNNPPPPPPATPPPPPPPSGTDLGPDPGIGTPGDPTAPTNIMQPVFDWLPDLPAIELNTAGAECPTWSMQPFPGPEWSLTMDKHCPFIADNAALISTIMILGFTVGSAMIILRA